MPVLITVNRPMPSWLAMSSLTASVAVAVRASTRGRSRRASAGPISRNAGRKSWPHCEMQCASSITSRLTVAAASLSRNSGSASRSGVVKTIFASPAAIARSAASISAAGSALFSCQAATPSSRSLSHWSFISAISGETTTVRAGQQQGRQLVAERLAAAGRHQGQGRRPAHDARDHGLLAFAQAAQAKSLAKEAIEASSPRCRGSAVAAGRGRHARPEQAGCRATIGPACRAGIAALPGLTLLTPPLLASPLRSAITAATRTPEPELLPALLEQARLSPADDRAAHELAMRVARGVRERARDSGRAGLVQGLLQEFALSSSEGVALMCLAEALLRIPDAATRDALIRDKISSGDWRSHLGQSPSLFVNAATWGLLLTGRLVATHSDVGLGAALRRVVGRGGEPLIRRGVDMAMRLMGEQFVTGETIEQALANARPREAEGFRYSYDMLGEAAMTARDAEAYLAAYEAAIQAIGRASAGRGIVAGPGISIKLSALHPRYSRAQVERVMDELYPRLLQLAELACRYDIGLNIDAEEADRLELSLDLLEKLCFEPALAGWNGIGFVIQAYQKRCPAVVDWLIDLARRSGRRLMVRLVKGAYWDGEIKRAQLDGQAGYPVYTRKAYTDVAYLACARKLLAAPDEIYPQFATHNAHTLAAVCALAGPDFEEGQYEFQCLHGMGEPLYEQVVGPVAEGKLGRPAASTRRSAPTTRCSPTWCGDCSRTAPTPRSSIGSPATRCRSRSWCRTRCGRSRRWPLPKARSACRIRRFPCRARCSEACAPTRSASTSPAKRS